MENTNVINVNQIINNYTRTLKNPKINCVKKHCRIYFNGHYYQAPIDY